MKSVEVDGNQIEHNKEAMNAHWEIHVELVYHAVRITIIQAVLNLVCVSLLKKEWKLYQRCMFLYIYFLSFYLSQLEESNKKDTL